jgi:hypothetical protein
MVAIEKKLDMIMKAMSNHISTPELSLINLSQHYHEEEPPPVNWPQQYQEEECQSQFVANYNGQYMEDEYTYYLEQTTTTPRNEETVEENFCEPSLDDPLGEYFDQFCEQAVVENQVNERKEEQIEDLEEPPQEKEESTKTFSTLALIPETPRGQEKSLLELPNEQIEDIKIEKLLESSSYFIPVHDEKLFEKTQSGPPLYTDNWNPPAMGRHHSLWCKRRKDWCFKFKVPQSS